MRLKARPVIVLAVCAGVVGGVVIYEASGSTASSCATPDPHAYAGSECYSLSSALALHQLVLPATATDVHFKVAPGDQMWLTFTDSPSGLAEFSTRSHHCTPVQERGVASISPDVAEQVGWPFNKYYATVQSAQQLLNCIDGTSEEQDETTVYQESATVDVVYWYSESMQAFNN